MSPKSRSPIRYKTTDGGILFAIADIANVDIAKIKIASSLQNDGGILIANVDVAKIKIAISLQNNGGILIANMDVANIRIASSL